MASCKNKHPRCLWGVVWSNNAHNNKGKMNSCTLQQTTAWLIWLGEHREFWECHTPHNEGAFLWWVSGLSWGMRPWMFVQKGVRPDFHHSEDDKRGKRMRNSSVAKKKNKYRTIQLTALQEIIKKRWGHCTCVRACTRVAHSLFQYVFNMINGLEGYWQWVSFTVFRLPWQQMTLPRGGLVLSFGENCLLTLFFSVVHFCSSLCFILKFILVFLRL